MAMHNILLYIQSFSHGHTGRESSTHTPKNRQETAHVLLQIWHNLAAIRRVHRKCTLVTLRVVCKWFCQVIFASCLFWLERICQTLLGESARPNFRESARLPL